MNIFPTIDQDQRQRLPRSLSWLRAFLFVLVFVGLTYAAPVWAQPASTGANNTTPSAPTTPTTPSTHTGTDANEPGILEQAGNAAINCVKKGAVDPVTGLAPCLIGGAVVNAATDVLTDLGARIIVAVSFFVLMFGNFMLGIAGTLFNWVLLVTVYQFGTYFGNSAGVLLAWGILRDMANIVLLFGFIFIGLQTILDINHFSVKKALPRLLIFAVLLNFSLFVTEAVIDTTNVFSAVLSTQAGTGCTPDARGVQECINYGIAGQIMRGTGLAGLFAVSTDNLLYGDNMKSAMIYLGASLFSVIGAVVLFAAAIMLLIRAISLTFIMVLSPLGFASMAVPALEKIGKQWRDALVKQATFAPVLILLILVSLKISEGFKTTDNTVTGVPSLMAGLAAGNTSSLGVIVVYALIIGFLVASLVVAKKMGAMGADFATAAAGGAVVGTAAFIGRRTVGVAGMHAANAVRSSSLARTNPGLARFLTTNADKVAAHSFDARGGVVGKALGSSGIKLGNVNAKVKHGIHGIEEEAIKERTKFGASLKQTDEDIKAERKAKDAIDAAEKAHKDSDNQYKQRIDTTAAQNEAALEPEKALVRERRESLNAARLSGDAEKIKAAEQSLDTSLRNLEERKGELQKGVDVIVKERAEKKGEHDESLKTLKKAEQDAQQAPQIKYADALKNKPGWYATTPIVKHLSVGGHADLEGARLIVAELKKSKTDKAIEKLTEITKQGNLEAAKHAKEVEHAITEDNHDDHGSSDTHDTHDDHK